MPPPGSIPVFIEFRFNFRQRDDQVAALQISAKQNFRRRLFDFRFRHRFHNRHSRFRPAGRPRGFEINQQHRQRDRGQAPESYARGEKPRPAGSVHPAEYTPLESRRWLDFLQRFQKIVGFRHILLISMVSPSLSLSKIARNFFLARNSRDSTVPMLNPRISAISE